MMNVRLQHKTIQTISPQFFMFTKILQMPAQDLRSYISDELCENPLLDFPNTAPSLSVPLQRESYTAPSSGDNSGHTFREDWDGYYGSVGLNGSQATLQDYLVSQVTEQQQELRNAIGFLIYSLDQNGWLPDALDDLAADTGFPLPLLEEALSIVQKMDPAGVGARSLSECLLLQLDRLNVTNRALCRAIIEGHLPALSKKRYATIARALHTTEASARIACDEIRQMNPRPGAAYSDQRAPQYVIPDLVLTVTDESMNLSLLNGVIPEIRINNDNVELLRNCDDPSAQHYLSEYLPRARKLVTFISRRNATLLKITEHIINWQQDFLLGRVSAVVPMTLANIAAQAGVHETTVSRTVNEKYILTPKGVLALNSFFSRPVTELESGAFVSAEQIKKRIRELLDQEEGGRRLSDQKIANLLAAEGITIARRTVAKYRMAMEIPSASSRIC